MQYQNISINHFAHDCFQIKANNQIIYFDPYKLEANQIETADFVFITHGHFDHCSPEDLQKIVTDQTVIIASAECESTIKDLKPKEFHYLKPGEDLSVDSLRVQAVQAYNINKLREDGLPFHSPQGDELGYVVEVGGVRIYHAGDTDNIPELADLKDIDLALLPVSGTYVMTAVEAIQAVKLIMPKIAIPMHYGSVVGTIADAETFKQQLEGSVIKVEII